MDRYIKYEIRGSYKFILGIIVTVLIASTIMMINLKDMGELEGNNLVKTFLLIGSIMVIFGAYLTAFFHIIGSFRKELYEDRGFLTFSLPLSGMQILGSKLIVAIVWFLLLGISILAYNGFLAVVLYEKDWIPILKELTKLLIDIKTWTFIFITGLSAITMLIIIYFAIALSRVTIKKKKIGGLWFVLFLVMNSLYGFLSVAVNKVFPYYIDFGSWKILSPSVIIDLCGGNPDRLLPFVSSNTSSYLYYSISSIILTILVGVGAFCATSYIIENKIDL